MKTKPEIKRILIKEWYEKKGRKLFIVWELMEGRQIKQEVKSKQIFKLLEWEKA